MAKETKKRRLRTISLLAVSGATLAVGIIVQLLGTTLIMDVASAGLITVAWFLPVLLITRWHARGPVASRSDVLAAQEFITRSVTSKVEEIRKKQSRHEYHQERSLERIESEVRHVGVASAPEPLSLRGVGVDVLFVTSNGAGLGHISRLIAISRQLSSARRIEFLTMSTAYRQVADPDFSIHYFPSSEAAGEHPATWNPIFRGYFRSLVERIRPRVVVFDGTWVYTGITDVCRALGLPLVWVQRGLWKEEIDSASVQRHDARSVADEVIIPGDYAGPEDVNVGPGVEPHFVSPIVMTSPEQLLSRDDACARLGLKPQARYVLLNFGGGAISDPDSLVGRVVPLLRKLAPHITPVQLVSPLALQSKDRSQITRISKYPIMPHAKAFDAMITAAGYNSAQEAVALGIPSILLPNKQTRTDNQSLRAQRIAALGLCLVAESEAELEQAVILLGSDDYLASLSARLKGAPPAEGASEGASIIEKLCASKEWMDNARTIEGTRNEHANKGDFGASTP